MDKILENNIRNLIITWMILVLVGIVMVYSASYIYAKEIFNNPSYFVSKQVIFAVISFISIIVLSKIPFNKIYNNSFHIHNFVTFLLLFTLIPKFGHQIKGASRWIFLGSFSFQPGEWVKYTILFCSMYYFENFSNLILKKKILYFISLIIPFFIFVYQPDFGSFSICLLVVGLTGFLSSFKRIYFYSISFIGIVITVIILFWAPYRVYRIMGFLDPWKDPRGSGFQLIQSYLGFANGSFFGKGIGNGHQKLFYLPEAHNDFIFSVIGEELGLVGVIIIILMYIFFVYSGLKLSLKQLNPKEKRAVSLLTFTIGIQALLNVGVVLGLLPTKGLNLPFISSGGSSLLANSFALGLILSVSYGQIERNEISRVDEKEVSSNPK